MFGVLVIQSLLPQAEVSVVEHWHGRPSQIEVFPSWKMEYPDCCITTTRACYKEGSHYRRQACRLNIDKAVSLQECIF